MKKQVLMKLRSRTVNLNIFADTLEEANMAVREYIGVSSGALTESLLMNADEFSYTEIERDCDAEIEILYPYEIPAENGGGIFYETRDTVGIESYL